MNGWEVFEKFIERKMKQEQIPGLALAISKNNETIFSRGFGVCNVQSGEKVTANTIFGIASITKSFIAYAILQLEKRGLLSLQDSVRKYLPTFSLKNDAHLHSIKIHHLLSHTSGIPTVKRNEQLTSFDEHLAYLKQLDILPLGSPGAYFCYNNDLFLLLGAIVERVVQKDYRQWIEEEIIQPLHMTRTTFHLEHLKEMPNLSTPYQIVNGKWVSCEWPHLGNYAVGGGIRSTVTDLLAYGQMLLQDYQGIGRKVHQTHGKSMYGYGLQMTPYDEGITLYEHGGSQPGVSSNFGFIPEKNIVVAVLTNVSKVNAVDIWLAAVNKVLHIDLNTKRNPVQHYEMDASSYCHLIGTYKTGEGSTVELKEMNGKLYAVMDGEQFEVRSSSSEMFILLPGERPIRFYFNEQKEAWALFLGLRIFIKEK